MKPEDIRALKYSPAFVSEILYNFCIGSKRVDMRGSKFELIYLVLPFVMDDLLRRKLNSSNISSTFKTAFLEKRSGLVERLFFIDDKVKHSKTVTNDGLIYLNSICDISVDEYFNVLGDYKEIGESNEFKAEYLKAAYNLGSIFSKEGYVNVFLKAKVTSV
ncbi:three component ABC system middle component [Photobacterium sanguinicancri]|uniref:three component ABC system middle component n=1 Tax=Photobacterium sanguinicancri TaxID=875932 RepID=UPI000788C28A|nr:three component ABC system middle component [Photobacterium sanguinicancri]KXI21039.1 hypothetical protein AS132_23135 [Photobacterium sanguinicancri]